MTLTAVRLADEIDPVEYADVELCETTVDLFHLLGKTRTRAEAQEIATIAARYVGALAEVLTLAVQRVEKLS